MPRPSLALSIVLAFAAVPLWWNGEWLAGFLCAYAMSVLDSVDGKLARLTLTSSSIGNVLDHGLDIVHPPFWYWAWAWGLGARSPEAETDAKSRIRTRSDPGSPPGGRDPLFGGRNASRRDPGSRKFS